MSNNTAIRVIESPQHGNLYLLNAVGTDKFKIGKSLNSVLARIGQLQVGCPIRLRYVYHAYVEDMNKYERDLHLRFKQSRHIGEWFTLTCADVKECITLMRLVQTDETILLLPQQKDEELDKAFGSLPIPQGWKIAHPADITPLVRGVVVTCIRAGWSQTKTIQEVFGITKSGNNPNYDLAREVFQEISSSIN